ncbi:MAG: glycosyltransferase 87 family protein, partial [Thermoleophilia bacterium]
MAPPAPPPAAAPATTDPWRRRLLTLLIGLFAVGVVVGWASTSYFGRNPAAVESFAPTDGWCDPASQGLGVHCFGDFQVPRLFLDEESIYDPIYPAPGVKPVPNPYTPTSMAPHVFAGAVEWVGLGQRTSMVVFLVLLAVAMLAPALWSILGRPGRPRDWLPLLVIGVASGPFLTMMDRGNSAGFAVPFILLFALYVRRRPEWVAPVAMIGAALIRPQFILLALALIAFGRIRSAAAAVAAWAALSIAAFAVIPGGFASNLSGWWSDLADFQDQLDGQGVPVVASTEFINISAAHALT